MAEDDEGAHGLGGLDLGPDPLALFMRQLGRAVAGGFTGLLWTVAAAAALAIVTPAEGAGAWVVTGLLAIAPLVGIVLGVVAVRHPWATLRRWLLLAAAAAAVAMALMQSGLNSG